MKRINFKIKMWSFKFAYGIKSIVTQVTFDRLYSSNIKNISKFAIRNFLISLKTYQPDENQT